MSLQSFVTVALRVLAIYAGISQLTYTLPFSVNVAQLGRSLAIIVPVGLTITGIACVSAWVLWLLAAPMARIATRQLPQEVSMISLSLADGYSVAFLGIGLLYIGSAADRAICAAYQYLKIAATTSGPLMEQIEFQHVFNAFVPLAFGIVMLVKGRSWAVKLAKKHLGAEQQKPTAP